MSRTKLRWTQLAVDDLKAAYDGIVVVLRIWDGRQDPSRLLAE